MRVKIINANNHDQDAKLRDNIVAAREKQDTTLLCGYRTFVTND